MRVKQAAQPAYHGGIEADYLQDGEFRGTNRGQYPPKECLLCMGLMGRKTWS